MDDDNELNFYRCGNPLKKKWRRGKRVTGDRGKPSLAKLLGHCATSGCPHLQVKSMKVSGGARAHHLKARRKILERLTKKDKKGGDEV